MMGKSFPLRTKTNIYSSLRYLIFEYKGEEAYA